MSIVQPRQTFVGCLFTINNNLLEAGDVVCENLLALLLAEQRLGQQPQLHDHVGQPGRDLLLQEGEGVRLVVVPPVLQEPCDRHCSWVVPEIKITNIFLTDSKYFCVNKT